jgi:hypothetical protein
MQALYVDKTRHAQDEVRAGTEFPVQSIYEPASDGGFGRSTFIIAGPTVADNAVESGSAHERDMFARFDHEPLMTRTDLGAGKYGSGTQKRAWDALAKRGRIVNSGQKRGPSELWKGADARDELFPPADVVGQEVGQLPGPPRRKARKRPSHKGLRWASAVGGPPAPRDRPDDRVAPAAPKAGAPVSHRAKKQGGPGGPNPIGVAHLSGPPREGVPRGSRSGGFSTVTELNLLLDMCERDVRFYLDDERAVVASDRSGMAPQEHLAVRLLADVERSAPPPVRRAMCAHMQRAAGYDVEPRENDVDRCGAAACADDRPGASIAKAMQSRGAQSEPKELQNPLVINRANAATPRLVGPIKGSRKEFFGSAAQKFHGVLRSRCTGIEWLPHDERSNQNQTSKLLRTALEVLFFAICSCDRPAAAASRTSTAHQLLLPNLG